MFSINDFLINWTYTKKEQKLLFFSKNIFAFCPICVVVHLAKTHEIEYKVKDTFSINFLP